MPHSEGPRKSVLSPLQAPDHLPFENPPYPLESASKQTVGVMPTAP